MQKMPQQQSQMEKERTSKVNSFWFLVSFSCPQAILGLFEGEISLSQKETQTGIGKVLRIKKLYNQKYLENELILTREKKD
jgi:hypothetical protein